MNKLFKQIFLLTTFSAPAFAFAASPFLKPVKDLLGDLEIFINFLNWALPALAILIFFLLIIAFIANKLGFNLPGTEFKGSEGGKTEGGKKILWAIMALAAMMSVYGLIQLIGALFGVDTNRAKSITAPSLPQVGGVRGGGYYNQ